MQTEKNIWLRVLSIILTLALLISCVPNQVYAMAGEALADLFERKETAETIETPNETKRGVYEVTELREANVKHFALEDGTYTAAVYGGTVHTQDAGGNWQDIDNRLSDSGSEFATSNARIKFAKKITGNENLFTLHDGDRKITMSLNNAIKKTTGAVTNHVTEFDSEATKLQKLMTLDNLSSEILYADILDGVDLQYVVESLNVKENIIVKERKDSYQYTFTIALNNLEAEIAEDGSVRIYDPSTKETVYNIPAGFMYDANGEYSTAVSYTLANGGTGKYALTVTADAAWINAEERVFPVVIDPTISVEGNNYFVETFIDKTAPDTVLNEYDFLCAGYDATAYWKMTSLPVLPAGAYITDATYIVETGALTARCSLLLGVYKVTSEWNVESFCYSQYENGTAGQREPQPFDAGTIPPCTTGFSWDITEFVQDWYNNPSTNYGMAIAHAAEEEQQSIRRQYRFYSGFAGVALTLSYIPLGTLEGQVSTSSQSVGIAGTGYVNNMTGALSFQIHTLSTLDSLFSYPVSIVYNQKNAGKWVLSYNTNIPNISPTMGYGMKVNVNEYIIKKTESGSDGTSFTYYIWTDGYGAEHNFYRTSSGSNIYRDDDGLQMELTVDSNTGDKIAYRITDVEHNTRIFNHTSEDRTVIQAGAILSSIVDKNGNSIKINYTDWGRVTSIQVVPKGGKAIKYVTFTYNSYGQPRRLYNPTTNDTVKFYYSTQYNSSDISGDNKGFLRRVEHICKDEQGNEILMAYSTYEYDSAGRLILAKDNTANRWVEYVYDGNQIVAVIEYAGENEQGQKMSFQYNADYTEIRTSGSDDIYGTNDDILNIMSFDHNGRVISSYSTDAERTVIYGASSGEYETQENIKNNLKSSTSMGGVASNFIFNGGFERVDLSKQLAPGWDRSSNNISYISATHELHDHYSAKFQVQQGVTDKLVQYVELPEGDYSLSLDVYSFNTRNVSARILVESLSNAAHVFFQEIPLNAYNASGGFITATISFPSVKPDPHKGYGEDFRITIEVTGSDTNIDHTAYVVLDNIMLEENIGHSGYSMVESGSFEHILKDENGEHLFDETAGWTIIPDMWGGVPTIRSKGSLCGLSLEIDQTERRFADKESFDPQKPRYIEVYQTVYAATDDDIIAYNNGTYHTHAKTFVMSGMARGTCQIQSGDFRIEAYISYYNSETIDTAVIEFSPSCVDWQYGATTFSSDPNKMIQEIQIALVYQNNPGIGYFDNIYLTQVVDESTVSNEYDASGRVRVRKNGYFQEYYEYDSKGNVTRIANNQGELRDFTYTETNNAETETYYTFVAQDGTLVYPDWEANPDDHIQVYLQTRTECTYNNYGQIISSVTYNAETLAQATERVTASYVYDITPDSQLFGALLEETDSLGNVTKYFYDELKGRLQATVNTSTMTGTCYIYDTLGRITAVVPATYSETEGYAPVENQQGVQYTYYPTHQIESIITKSTTYTFTYDTFGKDDSIQIGSTEIVRYEYNDYNGKLNQIHYDNGLSVKYYYDTLENISKVCYIKNGVETPAYEYQYTSAGQLARFDNKLTGKSILYRYDVSNRIISFVEFDAEDMVNTFSATILYDDKSQVSKLSYTLDYYYGSSVTDYNIIYDYVYDGDGIIRDYEMESGAVTGGVNFIYDAFDRVKTRTYDYWLKNNANKRFTNTVEYTFVTEDGNTSTQVQSYKTTINDNATLTYTYTYDDYGNITKIQLSNGHQIRYVYDDLGQLLREDNTILQKTFMYSYDFAGNIISKRTYALTAAGATPSNLQSTNTYNYGDANWGDKLTAFNGVQFVYDAIGNPLSYHNGQSWNFEWNNGRDLAKASGNGKTLTFVYNDEGIRTSKTVNGVEHTYVLNGTQIVSEAWGNHLILYTYDIDSMPIGMQYRNTSYAEGVFDVYWFERNLQGDILGVYNQDGKKLVTYTYDAWGNVTTSYSNGGSTSSAQYNPFRYRGYYYDTELKMYYLQSRYYDPAIGRFINADSFISTDSGVLGSNMFAYCGNNPVMGYDPTGHFNWGKLFNGASLLAVGIVACAAAVTVVSGGACTPLLVAACATFVAGGMTVLNGAAEVVESFTDYNFMRDGVMGGNEELYEAQKEFFSTTAEIGTAVITMGSGSGKLCFAAGTVILINEGRKAIEDIVVGDYVWAWDEETGEKSLRRVTETYVNQTSELVHVFVGGEEIVTTPTHPFYSPVKGWTEAAQLRAGDILVLVNGEYVVVEKVQHEILESPINVYNFQVAGDHTYYVSDIGVLVHNGCERGVGGKGWRGDATWKQNVRTVANGGDVTNLNGGLPTLEEAKALITEAKGIIKDFHYAHYPDGKNTHLYEHLHYLTEKGIKGVIKVFGG